MHANFGFRVLLSQTVSDTQQVMLKALVQLQPAAPCCGPCLLAQRWHIVKHKSIHHGCMLACNIVLLYGNMHTCVASELCSCCWPTHLLQQSIMK